MSFLLFEIFCCKTRYPRMNSDSDPKTRRESKGKKERLPFSAKHIRAHEAIQLAKVKVKDQEKEKKKKQKK